MRLAKEDCPETMTLPLRGDGALQQPLDGEDRQKLDTHAGGPRRLGVRVVVLLARCTSLDPFQALAVGAQAYFIRQRRHFDVEEPGQTEREDRIAEHQT